MTELFDWNEQQTKEANNKLDRSIRKSREGRESINEAFAARRAALLQARRTEFGLAHGVSEPDFAPFDGFCIHRNIHKLGEPTCGFDLVAHYAEDYPTAFITGCPECGSSYCD